MHRILVGGIEHDLCPAAMVTLFSRGQVTTRCKRVVLLSGYASIQPAQRGYGVPLYCDVHGSNGCP